MRRLALLASSSVVAFACGSISYAQSSTETYTYDSLGRLVKVVTANGSNNGETDSICYDDAGNRTQYVSNTSAGSTVCSGSGSPPPPPPPRIIALLIFISCGCMISYLHNLHH